MAPDREPLLALVGQPNCGKSTLFNAVAGFRAHTANFPGTTVSRTEATASAGARRFRIVDLPGTYSLSAHDPAEKVTRDFLFSGQVDAVIAVVDASVLARSIELVLQLVEMGVPMVVALNMMDEARRKGIEVDASALGARLGVPVVPTVATRGQGVAAVMEEALAAAGRRAAGEAPRYDKDVEEAVEEILQRMPPEMTEGGRVPPRFAALRLLEADADLESRAASIDAGFADFVRRRRRELAELHGWPEEAVLASHRHAVTMDLFEAVAKVSSGGRRGPGERLDGVLLHPLLGLPAAVLSLALIFGASFWIGDLLSGALARPFERLSDLLGPGAREHLGLAALKGLLEGVGGGAGIVLPYLVPLLLVLSLLEDVGYLPRLAYLMDGLLHRARLHGRSVVPLILGYGCTVPAVMGARIMENPRDRLMVVLLAPLVPCSARSVVILALVGAVLGPWYAAGVYFANVLVTALVGRCLGAFLPGEDAGLLMEVPPYRLPAIASLLKKTWFRARDFLVGAWPLLVAASAVMGVLEFAGAAGVLNRLLSQLTAGWLGLPPAVGVTLVFGVLRKELSLLLLSSALGTTDVAAAMSPVQILTFAVFVTFYVPCVSSMAVQIREVGWRWTLVSALINTAAALAAAGLIRLASLAVFPGPAS